MAISQSRAMKERKVQIELDATELSDSQIRQIKALNTMITHLVSTDDEGEFFDGSAEFMRMCASLIKQARFADDLKDVSGIPYAEQALEYSMDVLQEHIGSSKVVTYDN